MITTTMLARVFDRRRASPPYPLRRARFAPRRRSGHVLSLPLSKQREKASQIQARKRKKTRLSRRRLMPSLPSLKKTSGRRRRRAHHLPRRVGSQAAGRARRPGSAQRDRHGLFGDGGKIDFVSTDSEKAIRSSSSSFFSVLNRNLVPLSSLLSFPNLKKNVRATSRPPRPSPRNPALSPAPTSTPPRGATPSVPLSQRETSTRRSLPSTTPTRRSSTAGPR